MSSSSRSVRPIDRAIRDSDAQTLVSTGRSVPVTRARSEEHTSELQSQSNLVCRLLLEKKKTYKIKPLLRVQLLISFCVSYYSLRAEVPYSHWRIRVIFFASRLHPDELCDSYVTTFLGC